MNPHHLFVFSCPLFFRENATIEEDKVSGGLTFILALVVVIVSTMGMIVTIKLLLHGLSVRVVHAVTRCNGYFGILFGGALTVFVQSSQAVVSTLVPVAGVGALPLETIYPIVVGSNVGTALQTVMVSFSAFGTAPLQVALAHLFFNITGMMLWYPIPHLRVIPMWAARKLGQGAKIWRLFPLISIVIMYVAIPLLVWGLSNLFLTGHKAAQVFVIVFGILGVLCLGYLVYWFSWNGGVEKCVKFFSKVKSISGSEFTDESSGALSLSGDVESDSQFLRQSKTIGHSKAPCSLSNVEEDKPMEVFEESESERSNASLSC